MAHETKDQAGSHQMDQMGDKARQMARSAASSSHDAAEHYVTEPASDLIGLAKDYLKEKPDIAAMWCFGIGFIVGWKLKP